MMTLLLLNGFVWCLLGLIWKSNDGVNLSLKLALFALGLWNLLAFVKG